MLGLRVVESGLHRFGGLLCDAKSVQSKPPSSGLDLSRAVFNTMTTCHSLRLVDDELVGDPLDQKMFEFTGWLYSEGEQSQGGQQENIRMNGQGPVLQSKFSPPIVRPPPGMGVLTEINNEASTRVSVSQRD